MSVSTASLPRRFRYRLSPVNMRRGLWVVAVSLLIFLALGFLASESLTETLLEDLRQQPGWALALTIVGIAVLTFLIFRIVRMAGEASLVADGDGLRCSPHPHHGSRRWLRYDWALPWSAIDRAVVQRPDEKAQHIQSWINTTLTLETAEGDYSLPLLLWEPEDDRLDRPDLMAFRPGKRLHALTESHPLIGHFEHHGIEVAYRPLGWRGRWGLGGKDAQRPEDADRRGPVDLFAYPVLVAMLGFMALLAVVAALHFTVLPPIRALWSPEWGSIVLLGSVVFAIAALAPTSAPVRERTVVALLLGATVAGLWFPLSVRTQALLAGPPDTVAYIVGEPGLFEPLDPGYPSVDLTDLDIPEYWESLAPGASYTLELKRVGESDWVLRLGPVFERTRAFYEAQ
jgi:hypothetical protein